MRWSRDTSSSSAERRPPPLATVRDEYDAHAYRYDLLYADRKSRLRHALLERPAIRITRNARRVLEIGCGTGRLLRQLSGGDLIGIDISKKSLRFARAKGFAVAQADAHALPFASGAFDAVVAATGVLTYLDYGTAFAEMARVLTPGGRIAVHQFAAHTFHVRPVQRSSELAALHLRSIGELDAPAAQNGLISERVHYYRTVRIAPYLLPIPRWAAGSFWSHVIAIYRKPEDAKA